MHGLRLKLEGLATDFKDFKVTFIVHFHQGLLVIVQNMPCSLQKRVGASLTHYRAAALAPSTEGTF